MSLWNVFVFLTWRRASEKFYGNPKMEKIFNKHVFNIFFVLFFKAKNEDTVETSREEIRYAIEREIREIIIDRLISLFSTCDWNRYT